MNKFLKVLVIALCAVMLVVGTVAATLAYLKMTTETVENTFTAGDIEITLVQANELDDTKMMPGLEFTVDPKVTVSAGSEKCWLFIKIDEIIDEPAKFSDYLSYTVATGWTPLDGHAGVYYREVNATETNVSFDVIQNNTVTANADCTKSDYDELDGQSLNLDFTAYAVQFVGFDTPALAWAEAQTLG